MERGEEERREDRRGGGEGRRWTSRLDVDADADAGFGAALTVPLGAQKISQLPAPGLFSSPIPASPFLLSLSLMETRICAIF